LNDIGAGHPSIDLICKISEKYGLASKLTGKNKKNKINYQVLEVVVA
jgi:hypothetical protein